MAAADDEDVVPGQLALHGRTALLAASISAEPAGQGPAKSITRRCFGSKAAPARHPARRASGRVNSSRQVRAMPHRAKSARPSRLIAWTIFSGGESHDHTEYCAGETAGRAR